MVTDPVVGNLGKTLASGPQTRIQLCGRLTARIDGKRVEEMLPGRQGRLLFAYLVSQRWRSTTRPEMAQAIWPERPPAAADTALSALLTKLRRVLGEGAVVGKHDVRLSLPSDAWVDLEAASEGLHRAESAVAQSDWTRAWGPARVALHIGVRRFLPGYEGPWVEEIRTRMNDILLRAHECVAAAGISLGGPELASADRSAQALVRLAPYRESGYRFLMEVLAAKGNVAEALLTYERLRSLLREELGASPGAATQAVHKRLLQGDRASSGTLARELKSVLFCDIAGSTDLAVRLGDRAWRELLSRHYAVVRENLRRFDGLEVDTAGDGLLATFDSPGQAVRCACAIVEGVRPIGVRVRSGIHVGECEVVEGRVTGIAVHVGARIAAAAQPDEILVSATAKDLMAGSGVTFEDRGVQLLRGVPGEWRLFSVEIGSARPATG